jgi:hypothetical protein
MTALGFNNLYISCRSTTGVVRDQDVRVEGHAKSVSDGRDRRHEASNL